MGSGASKEQKKEERPVARANPRAARTPRSQASNFREVQLQRTGSTPAPPEQRNSNMAADARQQPQGGPQGGSQGGSQGGQGGEIVFEVFTHNNGKKFQCLYTAGSRFYLDELHSIDWQPFPQRWYNSGRFVTVEVVHDQRAAVMKLQQKQQAAQAAATARQGGGSQSSRSQAQQEQQQQQQQEQQRDDREGVIRHPKRGRVHTYLFRDKQYIHCYYNKNTGTWLRLPLGWELQHNMITQMVNQIQEAVPSWDDRFDILASLRSCNYNLDECITQYLHIEGDDWLRPPRSSKDAENIQARLDKVEALEAKVKELERELEGALRQNSQYEEMINDLQLRNSELEAERNVAAAQMEAMQQARPRTARPRTAHAPQPVQVVVEEKVTLENLEELNDKAKDIHKAQLQLKSFVDQKFGMMRDMVTRAAEAARNLSSQNSGKLEELEEIRELYQKEVLQRKLLYNQLQEMRGNIRVFCRVRFDDRCDCCLKFPTDQDCVIANADNSRKTFSYDKVFAPQTSQEQVFKDVQPIITSCVDGYNVCLMAYGQTGSGKTFTMMGTASNPGINIRAITELLQVCGERTETQTYTLMVSMVEIYNETVQDLLSNDVKVVELHAVGNVVRMPGLTEHCVNTVEDIQTIMEMGDKNRSVASTKMNSTSSRSHLLLMIKVEGRDKVTEGVTRGMLTLCDLAGSERVGKTEATGQRLVEAAAINKSLSSLGQVFSALRTGQLHVPYRNSKLTQILRPCLGGDAKACLFVNVSPDVNNFGESVNTLEFGANARQVALGQAKQNIKKGPPK